MGDHTPGLGQPWAMGRNAFGVKNDRAEVVTMEIFNIQYSIFNSP